MTLIHGGGWVHTSAMGGVHGASCAICRHTTGAGWVAVAEQAVVCHRCLPDPDAARGLAGRRMRNRLRRVHERERERDRAQPGEATGEAWTIL